METNYSLKERNTFHFNINAAAYSEISHPKMIQEIIMQEPRKFTPILIIGEGSNLLFRDAYRGHVIRSIDTSIEVLSEHNNDVLVRAASGVKWDDFVQFTVDNGYGGIENLSWIPGTVGASPIQNIGAYGIEVKDSIEYVEGLYLNTGEVFFLEKASCLFGYRDSIFKHELRGRVFISHVTFRLSSNPSYHLDYGALKTRVESKGAINLSTIRESVIEIRKEKLPDPDTIGNAGSFFKNPVIPETHLSLIQQDYPEIPFYELKEGYKIPAGWLIDTAGWKGYRQGDAGVHTHQALVLVNYGNAEPSEVLDLAENICRDIKHKFGIELEMEVTIV
ncbi:MAG: UDP-N-acetylmuramate dehydrogenase [Bacteroidota bacterium]|nr:UDP-N-acetylmuramate dehydrogenase [Bacteroidota bacterium]